MRHLRFCLPLALAACAFWGSSAMAQPIPEQAPSRPALVVTDDPLPTGLQDKLYQRPRVTRSISPDELTGTGYFGSEETVVSRKVEAIRAELFGLQTSVMELSERLSVLKGIGQDIAAEYHASVATIGTQLQSGTTPGNPRLVKRLSTAQVSLEALAGNVTRLNELALEVAQVSSMAAFLLESARATYNLSGAVEEDHVRLSQLEDVINNTIVVIDRILNNVNDDISRTSAYLTTERGNLRTLALAITQGDLYGKSLGNRPFSAATRAGVTPVNATASAGALVSQPAQTPSRPLVKIRFDRPDVAYEQPVYLAVNEALERYPAARFELIAVHPAQGNSAQIALESTRARRNAERVLRTLTQMGMPLDRIDLSYSPSVEAVTNEVHIYIR